MFSHPFQCSNRIWKSWKFENPSRWWRPLVTSFVWLWWLLLALSILQRFLYFNWGATKDPSTAARSKHVYTLFFYYKNKLYKNTQAEICPKIKNKLRTITSWGWNFYQKNLRNLFNPRTRFEMYMTTKLVES